MDQEEFCLRGTMMGALIDSSIGEGKKATEVSPDVYALFQLLSGRLLTQANADLTFFTTNQLVVAMINGLATLNAGGELLLAMIRHIGDNADALRALRWEKIGKRISFMSLTPGDASWFPFLAKIRDRDRKTLFTCGVEKRCSDMMRAGLAFSDGSFWSGASASFPLHAVIRKKLSDFAVWMLSLIHI